MELKWKKSKINGSDTWKSRGIHNYEIEDVNSDKDRKLKSHSPFYIHKNIMFIASVKSLENAKQICELIENG